MNGLERSLLIFIYLSLIVPHANLKHSNLFLYKSVNMSLKLNMCVYCLFVCIQV